MIIITIEVAELQLWLENRNLSRKVVWIGKVMREMNLIRTVKRWENLNSLLKRIFSNSQGCSENILFGGGLGGWTCRLVTIVALSCFKFLISNIFIDSNFCFSTTMTRHGHRTMMLMLSDLQNIKSSLTQDYEIMLKELYLSCSALQGNIRWAFASILRFVYNENCL